MSYGPIVLNTNRIALQHRLGIQLAIGPSVVTLRCMCRLTCVRRLLIIGAVSNDKCRLPNRMVRLTCLCLPNKNGLLVSCVETSLSAPPMLKRLCNGASLVAIGPYVTIRLCLRNTEPIGNMQNLSAGTAIDIRKARLL